MEENKKEYINKYIANIAQQEILKEKLKDLEIEREFSKIYESLAKITTL